MQKSEYEAALELAKMEINSLRWDLKWAVERAEKAEAKVSPFKVNSLEKQVIPVEKKRGPYKNLSELTNSQYRNKKIKKLKLNSVLITK